MAGAAALPDPAPLYDDVADGPPEGRAWWLDAAGGVRVRSALWPGGRKGTVLLFPGRTEYIEKYGRAARDLGARDYATAVIDWRGQGLSDRALDDILTGHVHAFLDYQADVAALTALLDAAGAARPWFLLAHSMGGAIGLRALLQGLDVAAAAFSAPMWGINMPVALRPVAWGVSWAGRSLGLGHRYAPGTGAASYVNEAVFEENLLTRDREMFAYMARQTAAHPDLALGGPSLHWLMEALQETRALRRLPAPATPVYCSLGSAERIVDPAAIRARMQRWPQGRLDEFEGVRHEVMMEGPEIRRRFFDAATSLFDRHRETEGHAASAGGARG